MRDQVLVPLTSSQVEILKRTFRSLDSNQFVNAFYTKLFDRHPSLRSMFPTDLTDLTAKLISVFELVIYSFVEHKDGFYLQREVLAPLRELGRKHTDKGVEESHYPIVNDLLLETMGEQAGYIFPAEAEHAWRLALQHLSHAMLNEKVVATQSASRITLRDSFKYIKEILTK